MRLVLTAVLLLAACGHHEAASASSIHLNIQGGNQITIVIDDGLPAFESGGIRSLGYFRSQVTLSGDSAYPFQLGDVEMEIRAMELFVGEESFGALEDGDEVHFTEQGVLVNGELRGELPE